MKINDYSILVIEDEFIASEYLIQILCSFEVKYIFKATSFDEAIEIVKNNRIDLVFMDINIQGGIDGIKCSSLINKEYFIPIIFTTAYGDTNTINEAKEENIFGYLIKPFQESDVEASLSVALSSIKRIKEFSSIDNYPKNCKKFFDLGEDYIYCFESKTLTFKNTPLSLTKKEIEVLNIFCNNINHNISYEYIKDIVWPNKDISDSTIRDIISRLKKKIPHISIENISNYGYILKKPS